jgi:uncharacterized protein YciI
MFIVLLTYLKPLDVIDQHLTEHRAFLEEGYQKDYFIASGPCDPRTGGVIISQLKDREQLNEILSRDPFALHHLAKYEVIAFTPVKYHSDFKAFIVSGNS